MSKKRGWSPEDVEFLIANWKSRPGPEIADYLQRPYNTVAAYARRLGLASTTPRWNSSEINFLKEHWGKIPGKVIAEQLNRSYNAVKAQAHRLGLNGRLAKVDRTVFDEWNEASSYWFGFLMADGCVYINNRQYTLALACHERDRAHVERFRKFLRTDIPIRTQSRARRLIQFAFSDKALVTKLAQKGLVPRKTFRTRFPDLPSSMYRHFIRGYLDGDGNIYWHPERGLQLRFPGTKSFLEGLRTVIKQELGISSRSRLYRFPRVKGGQLYSLRYWDGQARAVLAWLYRDATIYLPRKYVTFNAYVQYLKERNIRVRKPVPDYRPAVDLTVTEG